jgi:predicted amidohydrolase
MRVSLLQPYIIRGDIEHNLTVIQRLVDESQGDLLVLAEYALTGSLVLDLEVDVRAWALRSAEAKARFSIPEGKHLLLNTLAEFEGQLYNCCELLPTGEFYCKLFPDQTELEAGILPGTEQKVFELSGKRFRVVICYDLPHMDRIATDNLDFLLFIYHFTAENFSRVMRLVKEVSKERGLRVLASSLVSDKNNGFSSFVDGDVVVSLPRQEGILEVEIE